MSVQIGENTVKHPIKHCSKRCKGFMFRFGVWSLSILAVTIVLFATGEVITFGTAFERIAEALAGAAADSFAD